MENVIARNGPSGSGHETFKEISRNWFSVKSSGFERCKDSKRKFRYLMRGRQSKKKSVKIMTVR